MQTKHLLGSINKICTDGMEKENDTSHFHFILDANILLPAHQPNKPAAEAWNSETVRVQVKLTAGNL